MTSITPRRKSVKSLKSDIGGNDIRSGDHEDVQPLNNNYRNTKSAFTSVPNSIDSPPRQLTYNHTKQVLYSGQIAYSSGLIFKIKKMVPETSHCSSANFVSLYIAKSHKHII